MPFRYIILPCIALLALGVGLSAYFRSRKDPVRDFRQVGREAKKAVNCVEVQSWATNLLTQSAKTTNINLSDLGTNYPSSLRGLYTNVFCFITVLKPNSEYPNIVPSVRISWGTMKLGHAYLKIGPPGYEVAGGAKWHDGVYFIEAPPNVRE
jgi:hypothetical protein